MKKTISAIATAILAGGALGLSSQALALTTCADLLVGNTYLCDLKNSDGTTDEDVLFTFSDPTPGTTVFTLEVQGLTLLGDFQCSCDPSGSFRNPKYDVSKEFTCVFDGNYQASYSGKAIGGGRIKDGKTADTTGATAAYECVTGTP